MIKTSIFAAAVAVGATLTAPMMLVAQTPAVAAGDAKHGSQLFLQCRACHVVASGAPSTIGPNLAGVVGAKAGSRAGYGYSPAMASYGRSWTPATLDAFLKKPSAAVPGTKMAFAGVADAKSRADIIAYLTTLKAR